MLQEDKYIFEYCYKLNNNVSAQLTWIMISIETRATHYYRCKMKLEGRGRGVRRVGGGEGLWIFGD